MVYTGKTITCMICRKRLREAVSKGRAYFHTEDGRRHYTNRCNRDAVPHGLTRPEFRKSRTKNIFM